MPTDDVCGRQRALHCHDSGCDEPAVAVAVAATVVVVLKYFGIDDDDDGGGDVDVRESD